MKNVINIIIFIFAITASAQEGVEVPLNSLSFEHPNGTYIKDLNNVYEPYVGTWRGEKYGKELTIEFVKFEHQVINAPNGAYYYEDELMAKYQVKDVTSGTIISTTMNAINYEDYKIMGLGSPTNGRFDFLLRDDICGNTFNVIINNVPNNPNQIKFVAVYSEYWDYINCNYTYRNDIPKPIPFKINIILIKQ